MYVLIKWIKENKVSVGLENYVRDKKMLGDPKRIGLVEHGAIGTTPPKGGWKTFPAQILCVNESLGEIRKAECQWIETHKLSPKDTIATDDDGFSDDGDESPQNHEVQDVSYWTPKRPKNKSVTELMNPIALDYTQKCENYKKLTRALMDSVFTVEGMSKCSVTGKKGLIGEQRPCLDKAKVRLVIGSLLEEIQKT
ncbi:uncharacterized protein LOC131538818 isoform X2 [Onychostoma macrolepis]|uniref:uncharacterized protein LOC131538818 isoform X2 n=1 Tax=Onychostoma macrolepis TaxID=369639 RepID=UPI00272B820D|nr:uncharacterized protein LOC131538818 isoform X2 [Onychostoma macrolepis]